MDPRHLTRADLYTDLESRVQYMKSFLDFTDGDCQIMNEIKPIAKPLVPEIVASAYNKLLSYGACRMAFFPRKDGAQGTHGTTNDLIDVEHRIDLNSATIKLRRNILERWAMRIFTADYHQMEIFEFFDQVGAQHVGGERVFSGGIHKPVFVDYIHLAMTLGYITSQMTSAILSLPSSTWPPDKKNRAVSAFHKISTIHNDLLSRHHIGDHGVTTNVAAQPSGGQEGSPTPDVSPQNRRDYYNKVFVVRSSPVPTTKYIPSPPEDAPFQSLINVSPSSTGRPTRTPRPTHSELANPTPCMQFTMTTTSNDLDLFPRTPHLSSPFHSDPAYFPGSFAPTPGPLPPPGRRMSKRTALKFGPKHRP